MQILHSVSVLNNALTWSLYMCPICTLLITTNIEWLWSVAHTYWTCQVGIVLVVLARIVTCGCIATFTEIVRIVTAHEIHSTDIVSSVIVVWLCSDFGIVCEKEQKQNRNTCVMTSNLTQEYLYKISYIRHHSTTGYLQENCMQTIVGLSIKNYDLTRDNTIL